MTIDSRLLRPIVLTGLALAGTALAADMPRLQPGLWQFTNVPTGASLDGRALGDLPYTPPDEPQRVCLSAAEAADPAAWLARDSGAGCSFTRRDIAGGRALIAGSCPPHDEGRARGTVRLEGRWTATSYDLRFATETDGENGRMGFTGTMTGRRVGDCPAS